MKMKETTKTALANADLDDTEFLSLTKESFSDLLKELPKGKAPDIKGLTIDDNLGATLY